MCVCVFWSTQCGYVFTLWGGEVPTPSRYLPHSQTLDMCMCTGMYNVRPSLSPIHSQKTDVALGAATQGIINVRYWFNNFDYYLVAKQYNIQYIVVLLRVRHLHDNLPLTFFFMFSKVWTLTEGWTMKLYQNTEFNPQARRRA